MDTSKTYIKMRLAAIPDMGRGDTSLTGHITQVLGNEAVMDEYGNYYTGYRSMCFKLERQDQLQEMVTCQDLADYAVVRPNEPPLIDNLLSAFSQYCNRLPWMGKADGVDSRPSMEQLWLAFVMKEKYNKTWLGTNWI